MNQSSKKKKKITPFNVYISGLWLEEISPTVKLRNP